MKSVRSYDKLKAFLLESNIKIDFIADLIGVDVVLIELKMNRKGEDFTLKEVRIICSYYNLDANEFFLIHWKIVPLKKLKSGSVPFV